MRSIYRAQVDLLLRCIPEIDRESCFAIKGGTAINLFVRDMPRLSVDIDLTYLPLDPRPRALANISEALGRIATSLRSVIPGVVVQEVSTSELQVARLTVRAGGVTIKVEPNIVLRGCVFAPVDADICPGAEQEFQRFVTTRILSKADLYGGKLCAALDRQHPRDLFDVKLLLENEGLTDDIRKAFVVYLASHNRPMHELLTPNFRELSPAYENQFVGMVEFAPSKEELESARAELVKRLRNDLTNEEKAFLLSVKRRAPRWDALGIEGLDRLPGIQWKLMNLKRMDERKHSEMLTALEDVLRE